jgi:hypothetical protein
MESFFVFRFWVRSARTGNWKPGTKKIWLSSFKVKTKISGKGQKEGGDAGHTGRYDKIFSHA